MFTGGTTGVPKMVPWTRKNIAGSVRAIIAGYELGPRDATVAVMPLYHGHGLLAALLATLVSGGTVLLPARGRFSAHTFWDDIDAVAGHLVHRGPDDSPDPVGAGQNRPAGKRTSRFAFHPQLQRPAHRRNGAGAAGHVLSTGGVRFRHDRGHPPGCHDSYRRHRPQRKPGCHTGSRRPLNRAGNPDRRVGRPARCPRMPSGRSGCMVSPWCAATLAIRRSPPPTSPTGGCAPVTWDRCRRPAT